MRIAGTSRLDHLRTFDTKRLVLNAVLGAVGPWLFTLALVAKMLFPGWITRLGMGWCSLPRCKRAVAAGRFLLGNGTALFRPAIVRRNADIFLGGRQHCGGKAGSRFLNHFELRLAVSDLDGADLLLGHVAKTADHRQQPARIGVVSPSDAHAEPCHGTGGPTIVRLRAGRLVRHRAPIIALGSRIPGVA